jgi:hypothetical protein
MNGVLEYSRAVAGDRGDPVLVHFKAERNVAGRLHDWRGNNGLLPLLSREHGKESPQRYFRRGPSCGIGGAMKNDTGAGRIGCDHKKPISACVRIRPSGVRRPRTSTTTFGPQPTISNDCVDCFGAQGREVAMESTGVYWIPVGNISERGSKRRFELTLYSSAASTFARARSLTHSNALW